MKYLNYKPISSVAGTTATYTSSAIDLSQIYRISVQANVGAGTTMTGSIQLQVSNDEITTNYFMLPAQTHWTNLGSALALAAAGTSYLIPTQEVCYRAVRVVFTGDPGNDATISVELMALSI